MRGLLQARKGKGGQRRRAGEVKVVGWWGTIVYGGPGGRVSGVTCGRRVDGVSALGGGGSSLSRRGSRSYRSGAKTGRRARGFQGFGGLELGDSGRRGMPGLRILRSEFRSGAPTRRIQGSSRVRLKGPVFWRLAASSSSFSFFYMQAAASGYCDLIYKV